MDVLGSDHRDPFVGRLQRVDTLYKIFVNRFQIVLGWLFNLQMRSLFSGRDRLQPTRDPGRSLSRGRQFNHGASPHYFDPGVVLPFGRCF